MATKAELERLVSSLRAQINQTSIINARQIEEARIIKDERDKLIKDNQWLRLLVQSHMEILQRSTIKER